MKTIKQLGQHWLHDEQSLDAVADAVAVQRGTHVLEVGPGLGTLTKRLLDRGAIVTAVEYDQRLFDELKKRFATAITNNQLILVNEDILQFDLNSMDDSYVVAANIPYYLTSNLLRTLSEAGNPPQQISVLVQKEVAERVAAAPGDMSLLSVTTQMFYQPSLGLVVPARLFTPPPKVDSQILILKKRPEPLFPGIDTKAFFRLVKAGFAERRKKLRSSLSGGLHIDKQASEDICSRAGIDSNLRAQALSLQQWYDLYEAARQ